MRMSIRTTVGAEARRLRRPPRARCSASATTSMSVLVARAACGSRRGPSTGRRRRGRGWSWRVASQSGSRVRSTKPPPVAAPGGHLAAVDLHALADADQAVAERRRRGARRRRRRGPRARRASRHVADRDVGLRRARVLERVGQALLHDPVGREVDRARQRDRLALDVQLDRRGRRGARRSSRASRSSSPGCGASSRLLAVAPHRAEQAAHLGERGAPGLLDALERLPVVREAGRRGCAGRRRPAAPSR